MTSASVLRRAGLTCVILAAAVAAVTITTSGRDEVTGGPPAVTTTAAELVAFDSCESVLNGFRAAAAPHVGPYGFTSGAHRRGELDKGAPADGRLAVPDAPAEAGAAPSAQEQGRDQAAEAPEHSTTNTHEAGVDEPDLVKTDGRRIVTVTGSTLRVVDVATRRLTGSLALDGGYASEMLMAGDRALVIITTEAYSIGPVRGPARDLSMASRLVLVDLAGRPKVTSTLSVDGAYVGARQVDGVARLVVRSTPRLGFVYPTLDRPSGAAAKENRAILESSPVEDWLPKYELTSGGTRSEGRLVDCDRVRHPAAYSGTAMLTMLTLDLGRDLGTGDPITITADGDTVYGTGRSLYVADDRRAHAAPARALTPLPRPEVETKTAIHRFDLSGTAPPHYAGSGQVEGTLLNQYSLSEHAGHLRVATTIGSTSGRTPSSESVVSVLAQQGDRLVTVGSIGGLGRGERIHAVRFIGPVGYVVTFRQTDPLYTLDLSDPARPKAVGELKITGYSAYLHPAGENQLIGVGQEATEQGVRLGTQVSLLDVGTPADPRRIAQYQVAGGSSEVEFDPHAFLYWPAKNLLVVPLTEASGVAERPGFAPTSPSGGALVLRLEQGRINEVGRIQHPAPSGAGTVRRAIVIGDQLWTVSEAGAMVNGLDLAAPGAWVPFG